MIAVLVALAALTIAYIVRPRGRRCPECGAREQHGSLLGAWWHAEGCQAARPVYPAGSDRE